MKPSKKMKSESDEQQSGAFSYVHMSADEFRKQLQEPEPLHYIKDYFINNKEENNVSNYIKAGGSVAEITEALSKIDLKRREQSAIIFNALHLIVLKSVTEFSDQNQFRDDCKQLISNYSSELQAVLSSKTILKNKKIVLKLLASIAVASSSLASQILTAVSLSKEDLDFLSSHTDPLDDQTLRVSFIHFLLAFIIDQPTKVIEKLLMKKTWLPAIMPGLRYDSPFTVQLVITTLDEKIISNTNISKTAKVFAFNATSLFYLSELYTWNPKSWYDSNPQKTYNAEFGEDDFSSIRECTHQALLKVCTSSKTGIVFQDSLYGTSNTQKNYTLCNFLQKLTDPWDDILKKELMYKTLLVCPDIIKPVLNSAVPLLKSFSAQWLEVVNFFTDVITNIRIGISDQPLNFYLKIVQDIIVPSILLETIKNGKHLKTENESQRLCCINFISRALNNHLEHLKDIRKDQKDFYSFQMNLTSYFIHNLPHAVELLTCLKSAYINKQEELVKGIVNLFILYETVCTELNQFVRFDDTITQWIEEETSKTLLEEDYTLVLNLIRLEFIINPPDPLQVDLSRRLKWTTVSKNNKAIGLDIIRNLFRSSGFFVRSTKELDLWIYCIETNLHPDIGTLLAPSLKWACENTFSIYENLLKAQEHSSVAEVSDCNLDDFLELSINDDDVSGPHERGVTSILNLSPLLPSILHILSQRNNKVNDDFLVTFIVHYLHQMGEVNTFISLLKMYKCQTTEKILPFIESWMDQPEALTIPPFSKTVFSDVSKFILGSSMSADFHEITKRGIDKIEGELLLEESCFMACELSRLNLATKERLERIADVVKFCLKQEGLKVNLNRSAFISDFYPLRNVTDSDLTYLVTEVAQHTNLSEYSLAPFSHRLAFELKFAKKLVYRFENKEKLKKLLQVFSFSQGDTEHLISFVFSFKKKYFEYNGELSPWIIVVTHLLSLAIKFKIIIKEDVLIKLLSSLGWLSQQQFDISETYSVLLDYIKLCYSEISSLFMDALKDLFYTLSLSSHWHEELCIYIHNCLEEVDYSEIPLERAIVLIASTKRFSTRHSNALIDSAGVIYQGLCETPSPNWISNVNKIVPLLAPDTCTKICKRVKKHSKDINTSVESLLVIEDIFNKAEELYTLYSLTLSWLEEAMHSTPANEQPKSCREEMCTVLERTVSKEHLSDKSSLEKASQDLIMNLLLQGLKQPSAPMINLIKTFVKYLLSKLPPGDIFELLTSHSCFIDVLLGKSDAKHSALNLMLELLSLDSSLIQATHVPILLSSYSATLSKTDQLIVKLLQLYERRGCINLSCWKPYVWGEAAIDHYTIRSKISPSKPNPVITLELFERDVVHKTITNYPMNRSLDADSDLDDSEIYDPAFYLPLLSQLVGEMSAGWKVVASGAIALTLAALSSYHANVRAAAYHVLHRFYQSLDEQKDNLIWRNFIEALQGGVTDLEQGENIRISSIVTIFLARASIIMTSPDDPLYFSIHNFIYAKPHLKLNSVPAFLEMFHSHSNQRLHQRWILDVLKDGMRDQMDIQLALNCLIFKFILDYHSCSLASPKIKELIQTVIMKCLQLIDKKFLLIDNYSIIPWITCANPELLEKISSSVRPEYKTQIEIFKLYQKCT